MKKWFLFPLLLVMVAALVAISGCGTSQPQQAQGKVLKIGVIFGLTGPGSQHQLMERDSSLLAAEWINEKGGININGESYQLQLTVEDNKMTPPGSVDAATKLIDQDGVKFIIGSVIPVQVDAIASVTEKNKVLYNAVRTDIVHPDRPYSFTSNYGFAAPVPFLYEVLLEKYPGIKTMGYMIGDEPGARAVAGLSQEVAQARGLTLLEPVVHPFETSDYYPSWTKMMTLKPDAVDNGLKLPDNTANCMKQGRELGYKGPMIAAIPGDPDLLIKMVGAEYATDFIYASHDPYAADAPALIKEIVQRWEAKYNSRFDVDGLEAWDAVWVLAQAIEQAQSIDPTAVKNAWEATETFDTVRGTARMGGGQTFGINHMLFNPCPISRFKDGKVEFQRFYDPWIP